MDPKQTRLSPTPAQHAAIFARTPAGLVVGGAGTGKTTVLALRAMRCAHTQGVARDHISLIADSPRSRLALADTFARLSQDRQTTEAFASDRDLAVVTPPHVGSDKPRFRIDAVWSKALDLCRGIVADDTRVFDFLGKAPVHASVARTDESADSLGAAARFLADPTFDPFDTQYSSQQREVLREAYEDAHRTHPEFRQLVDVLREQSVRTAPLAPDHVEVREAATRLAHVAVQDAAFCERIERDWASVGLWPIPGIELRASASDRFSLTIDGHTLFANGYIPETRTFVVLGARSKIRDEPIRIAQRDGLTMSRMTWNKSRIMLGFGRANVLVVSTVVQLKNLARQTRHMARDASRVVADVLLVPPGEFGIRSLIEVLYETGAYASSQCRDPRALDAAFSDAMDVTSLALARTCELFHASLYALFERANMISIAQTIARLATPGRWLERIAPDALATIQHLIIDDAQNLTPAAVRLIVALHTRMADMFGARAEPSIFCAGDDWQTVNTTRGGSAAFLMQFDALVGGRSAQTYLLHENFRSPQHIIDCAQTVLTGRGAHFPGKRTSIACGATAELDTPVILVNTARVADMSEVLRTLLANTLPSERVQILLTDANPMVHRALTDVADKHRDRCVSMFGLHESIGTEADYVLVIGDCAYGADNALRNALHLGSGLAPAQTSRYGDEQRGEVEYLSHLAMTRATRAVIWMCHPYARGVFSRLPERGDTCIRTSASGAGQLLRKWHRMRLADTSALDAAQSVAGDRRNLTPSSQRLARAHS